MFFISPFCFFILKKTLGANKYARVMRLLGYLVCISTATAGRLNVHLCFVWTALFKGSPQLARTALLPCFSSPFSFSFISEIGLYRRRNTFSARLTAVFARYLFLFVRFPCLMDLPLPSWP